MKHLKFITSILMGMALMVTLSANAQSSQGDKLFQEGQKLQQTMTKASQNAAIKKYVAAKTFYTAASSKAMCDNQIAICRKNIQSIGKPTARSVRGGGTKDRRHLDKENNKTEEAAQPVVPAVKKLTNVSLSLSEKRLDFKAVPKEGATQSVKVDCNYDEWEIDKKPEWVSVYVSEDKKKLSVEAQANETGEERSGVVTIKCGDKEEDLVINQKKENTVGKVVGKIGGLFKKKK